MGKKISATPQSREVTRERAHETRDVNFKLIVFLLVLIFFSALFAHASVWGWLKGMPRGTHQRFPSRWVVLSPAATAAKVPALQVAPQQDLAQFERQEAQRLRSYAWIRPEAGIIQVPIDRAIELVAAQGLPKWQPGSQQFEFSAGSTNASADVDAAFLKKMAQASLAAIDLGNLAATKAKTSKLSDTGHKLVQEHRKLLQDIRDAAQKTQTTLPRAPDLRDQLAAQQLQQTQRGEQFDKTMARQLLADNAESLEELHDSTNQLHSDLVKGLASHLEEKLETEMQDLRDAAKSAGVSGGRILALIQEHQSAAAVAHSSQEEPGRTGPGTAEAAEPSSSPQQPPAQNEGQGGSGTEDGAQSSQSGSASADQSQIHQGPRPTPQGGQGLDAAYVRRLAQATIADKQLAQLGSGLTHNHSLARLCRDLLQNQSQTESKLASAAQALHIALPEEASLRDQLAWKQLQQQTGTNFEQGLARQFLSDQAALLQETENTVDQLENTQVKQLASQTLDSLKQHLEDAKQAAKASGLKPKTIEKVVATQLAAAGAPFSLMSGLESSGQPPGHESKSQTQQQGSASSAGGGSSGSGQGKAQKSSHQQQGSNEGQPSSQNGSGQAASGQSSSPNQSSTNSSSSGGGSNQTNSVQHQGQSSGTGVSPLQLQHQHAHSATETNQGE